MVQCHNELSLQINRLWILCDHILLIMKTIYFDREEIFYDSLSIRNKFQLDSIFLHDKAVVRLLGEVTLSPNTYFQGESSISNGVIIESGSILENVFVNKGTNIRPYSIIRNCSLGKKNIIGPFCFLRDNSIIANECIVGSHVEMARSKIGNNVKISHQAFLGDVEVKDNVIIGAGVVFCNYDGKIHRNSIVEENVLLGSGTMIISPIKIGRNSKIAAASVVTKSLACDQLFIQRR